MDGIIKAADRPTLSRWQKLVTYLWNKHIPGGGRLIKPLFLKAFHLPQSTSINKGIFISLPNVRCGESCYLGNTQIRAEAPVMIGNHVAISYNNFLTTSSHDFSDWSNLIIKPIVIGDNVWITTNCIILPGVTIGSNTVIGAGSVVTHDIPSGVLAAGNPCKVIKSIDFAINREFVQE